MTSNETPFTSGHREATLEAAYRYGYRNGRYVLTQATSMEPSLQAAYDEGFAAGAADPFNPAADA